MSDRTCVDGRAPALTASASDASLAVSLSKSGACDPCLLISDLGMNFQSHETCDDFVALCNVTISAGRTEFLCLLGPSGCGKTTLLNVVAGFLQPTSGSATLNGHSITGAGPDRGVVFQDYALFPWLTVRKNVQFGPKVRGASQAEQEALADKYLTMVGLTEFEKRYPHQLSGGMKQRVAIARAIANGSPVLLMDEPFGALDAMTRETIQEDLLRLTAAEPKLIIFVTHSVAEAAFLADRVIVMAAKPGRVVADIHIDLPHPRDRLSPVLTDYVRDIRKLIVDEPETVHG